MFEDTWRATLSDGRQFAEDSPELAGERSPWRELERMGREQGLTIVEAEATLGLHTVALEADDGVLVCGQAAEMELGLGGGMQRSVRYRWVCRQAKSAWLWRLTDGLRAWEIETTPGVVGRERMPSPPREVAA